MSDKTISSLEVGVEPNVVAERVLSPEARISDIQEQTLQQKTAPVETIPSRNDRSSLSNDSQGINQAERSPALHPGRFFQLASFATPAGWSSVRGEADRSSLDREFQSEIHVALMPFVEQLPIGAALVVDYELLPSGSGAVRLHARFGVDVATTERGEADLEGELQTCLSALSDHFSFRISETSYPSIRQRDTRIWIVRPLAVDLRPQAATGIGFATRHDDAPKEFRFPAMNVSRSAIGQSKHGSWQPWSASLHHGFKAARGSGHALRIRVRLTRERLSEDAMSSLRRLNADDLERSASDKDMVREGSLVPSPYSPTMLNALVAAWSAVAADALRVELEAEGTDGRVSESLLRILGTELFPGLPVEIVPADQADYGRRTQAVLDLSNLYPLAAGLPPLLPHPGLLETLDFSKHYNNPSFELASEGLHLGIAPINGFEHAVRISKSDQKRHSYLVGATGSGKTTFMLNAIRQHMEAGNGVAVTDPDDLSDSVLECVPSNRINDVVLLDPSDSDYPVGLNPLDFGDKPNAAMVNRLINDQMDIFEELYDLRLTGGPGFEMFYRYTTLLASTAPHDLRGFPKGPPTLLTIVAVLTDDDLRQYLLTRVSSSFLGDELGNDIVRFFEAAQKQSGDQSFKNWVLYVSCKLTRFLSNTRIRKLLCAPKRTLDFRKIMDERKILVVKLNKGDLGDQDTKLLGRMVTKFIFQAALSRSDVPREDRTSFYYFLDEFQNFVCRDVAEMLAESRKYGLSLTLAHQTLSQLGENGSRSMLNSILGNCANKFVFRVGLEEAKILEPNFLPHFDAHAMCQLPDRKVLARILAGNRPTPPFVFDTLPARAKPEAVDGVTNSEAARAWSRKTYSSNDPGTKLAKPPAQEKGQFKALFDLGTNDEGPSVGDGTSSQQQEPKMTLIGDLIAIRPGTVGKGRAYTDLREASERAAERWRDLALTAEPPPIQPELGRCYWTRNLSLILVCSVADAGASGLVIAGGHGEDLLRGTGPGEAITLSCSGKMSSSAALPSLLGLDLSAVADVSLEDNTAFNTTIDESGWWLLEQEHSLKAVVPGFYLTNNQSLVFVTHSKVAGTPWRATVCHGGHGIDDLTGEKPFESYKLSSIGQYEISGEQASKIPMTVLGNLAGMSLRRHLPLIGEDVPEVLATAF